MSGEANEATTGEYGARRVPAPGAARTAPPPTAPDRPARGRRPPGRPAPRRPVLRRPAPGRPAPRRARRLPVRTRLRATPRPIPRRPAPLRAPGAPGHSAHRAYPTPPAGGVPAVRLEGVVKTYGSGAETVHALRGVDLQIPKGTFTAVMGPSGSGKSTFLHCAAGLDKPGSGRVLLGDDDLTAMNENQLTRLRRNPPGLRLPGVQPAALAHRREERPAPAAPGRRRADRRRAAEVLAMVGLHEHANRRPAQLSGGQQQRVAIARALVTRPDVLFADEPTGALDTTTAADVLSLLRRAVDESGATIVMVTHDPVAASYADRVVFLAAGRLAGHLHAPTPEAVAARMVALSQPVRAQGQAA